MSIRFYKRIFYILILCFTSTFFFSCGLDTFYYLEGPFSATNQPAISNSDYNNNYVEFITNENQDISSDFNFIGTLVYYKIYGDYSSAQSDYSAIESRNTESNYGAAFEYIENRGYQELRTSTSGEDSFVIPATGQNKKVRIRLTDYGTYPATDIDQGMKALILIDDSEAGVPRRAESSSGTNLSFNFGWYDTTGNNYTYSPPVSGDVDFNGTTPSEGKYYVNLYAVATGLDVTYTRYYSATVLYLGTIQISSSSENNWPN